jgi:hypothetical protein
VAEPIACVPTMAEPIDRLGVAFFSGLARLTKIFSHLSFPFSCLFLELPKIPLQL